MPFGPQKTNRQGDRRQLSPREKARSLPRVTTLRAYYSSRSSLRVEGGAGSIEGHSLTALAPGRLVVDRHYAGAVAGYPLHGLWHI